MKDKESQLPISLAVAAKTTELDNIKIVSINYNPYRTQTVSVLRIGNIKRRLINKLVKLINKDIKKEIKKKPNATFYVYMMATSIYSKGLFSYLDTNYKID